MSDPEQDDEGPEGEMGEESEGEMGEAAGKKRDQMMSDVGVYCQLMEDNDNCGLEDLGDRFELCIQTVEELELKRDDLIREITLLLEPKLEDIRGAHEDIAKAYRLQAKEQVEGLESRIREMKIGVQLQQRRNTELEQLRSGLAHELSIYKGCLEIYEQLCTKEAKTE